MKKSRWNRRPVDQPCQSKGLRSIDEMIEAIANELRQLNRSHAFQSEVFRKQALLRLHNKLAEITDLAAGKLVFTSTETWRTVYQQVLESANVRRYLSVALIRSADGGNIRST